MLRIQRGSVTVQYLPSLKCSTHPTELNYLRSWSQFGARSPHFISVPPGKFCLWLFSDQADSDQERDMFAIIRARKPLKISLAIDALFWHAIC